MNKTKRIAFAAVGVVMAGTMAFGMFGCGETKPTHPADRDDINYDENYHLTYAQGTTLSLGVGNNGDAYQTITYAAHELAGTVTLADGKQYNQGDLKPAWKALQDQLGVTFYNNYKNYDSNKQLTTPITDNTIGEFDIITASSAAITENTDALVNLNDYLDYMPNYKAFLDANPVTKWSLTSTTVGSSKGAMYYAPYYDGNDDIEKYEMADQSWVRKLLDATDTTTETVTFAYQAGLKKISISSYVPKTEDKADESVASDKGSCDGTTASAESYMGKTGSWKVATSKPGDTAAVPAVGYVKVDYDAVKTALGDSNTELYKAVAAALPSGTNPQTESGNIVDIQNQVINATQGNVTGGKLLKITQEYIKAAYTYSDTENGTYTQLYGATVNGVTTKVSDAFNATYAAWDVDLLVALMRCAVTNPLLLGGDAGNDAHTKNIYGLAARQGTTQRRVDLTALAGELYGIRGMESRYEYMYIGADGNIKDARTNADSYNLISNMSKMVKEGLIFTGTTKLDGSARDIKSTVSMLLMHDYSNTQSKSNWSNKAELAPINTPVSKWDTDDDGTRETVMRFTESWRSVKNTGFCLTKAGAASSNDKLSACLAFVDYMFSNDGQILMTYGPMAASNTNPDGWWYGTEPVDIASNLDKVTKIADATQYAPAQYAVKANADGSKSYFAYNGKLYKGLAYAGGYVPLMTDASKSLYTTGNLAVAAAEGAWKISAKQNYTNYARKVIGSTLPIGNKNQGFEYQCTEERALNGTGNVGKSLLNGTIKHVKLSVGSGESKWYMICPTTFALDATTQTLFKEAAQTDITGKYFFNSSNAKHVTNLYIDILYYGFDSSVNIGGDSAYGTIPANGAACVSMTALGQNLSTRVSSINAAWGDTKAYFGI